MTRTQCTSRRPLRRWLAGLMKNVMPNLMAALLGTAGLVAGASAQTVVAMGGALKFDNHEVWSRIVQEAGGQGAKLVVLPTAAGNPVRSGQQIAEALKRHGAEVVVVPAAPRWPGQDAAAVARDPRWVQEVASARGVVFSGGAQELITGTLQPGGQPTPMLEAVWSVFRRGGVVAGTSAGAAIMSETMFRDAQDVLKVLRGQLRQGQEWDRGLGFVGPDLFIDQHFLKRGRLGRLLPLMMARGHRLGLGVEENSAAVIRGDSVEVLGARGVLWVDLRQATQQPGLPAFNVQGAVLSYLERGDQMNWRTGEVQVAADKRQGPALDPAADDYKPSFASAPFYMDMLGDNQVVHAMAHLMDSPERAVRGLAYSPQAQAGQDAALGFEFRLYKRPGARAWFTGSRGGEDYTVVQVGLDVTPVALPVPLYQPLQPLQPGGRAGGQAGGQAGAPAQAPEGRLPAPAPSPRP